MLLPLRSPFQKKRNLRRTLCLGVPWIGMHPTIYTRNIDSKFSFKKKQKEWALLQNEMPQ